MKPLPKSGLKNPDLASIDLDKAENPLEQGEHGESTQQQLFNKLNDLLGSAGVIFKELADNVKAINESLKQAELKKDQQPQQPSATQNQPAENKVGPQAPEPPEINTGPQAPEMPQVKPVGGKLKREIQEKKYKRDRTAHRINTTRKKSQGGIANLIGAILGFGEKPFEHINRILQGEIGDLKELKSINKELEPHEQDKKDKETGQFDPLRGLSEGGKVPDGQMVVVGDKPGQKTGSEEVVMGKDLTVFSNADAKRLGLLDIEDGLPHAAGGMSMGRMLNQGSTGNSLFDPPGNTSQAGHDVAGGVSGTVQGIVGTIGAMSGPEGELIATAVNEVINVFEKLTHTVIDAVDGFNRLSERLAKFSTELTEVIAQSKVREIESDVRIAKEMGPDLAKLYETSTDIWLQIKDILVGLGEFIIDILGPILEVVRGILAILQPLIRIITLGFSIILRFFTGGLAKATETLDRRAQGIIDAITNSRPSGGLSGVVLAESSSGVATLPGIGTV